MSNSQQLSDVQELPETHRTYKSLSLEELQSSGFESASARAGEAAAEEESGFLRATTPMPTMPVASNGDASKARRGGSVGLGLRSREMSWTGDAESDGTDYVLEKELGSGGMGRVYEAHQPWLGRTVAVKLLHTQYADVERAVQSFTAEGAVIAELEHPGIVPLYDLGHSPLVGAPFYAMKQVHGTTWTKLIPTQTNAERVETLLRVGDAVAFAHSKGIVHRDLKPDNVMLGAFGEVLVMDWGLAVSVPLEGEAEVTQLVKRPRATPVTDSTFGGTPAYMAPELTGPELSKIGPWSDVYLMGALLWRAVTGAPPHRGETLAECVANARANVIVDAPAMLVSACDEVGTAELLAIARKAMSTAPGDRHADVQAFQAALRAWQTHAQSAALTRRAATLLSKADTAKLGYHNYAMAVYTYEEALELWSENPCAQDGLWEARLALAKAAFKRGDLELAESVLAESGEDLTGCSLVAEIKQARKERACSEHHRATLKRTADKWSLAFELSPDAMMIIRQEDAVILEANANFEKATGWSRVEALGKSTAELGLWADADRRTEFITQLAEVGEAQGFLAEFRRKSGEIYDVLVSAVVAEFDGVKMVVANSRDITNLEEQCKAQGA